MHTAHMEGKVSVTPKSWLLRSKGKHITRPSRHLPC